MTAELTPVTFIAPPSDYDEVLVLRAHLKRGKTYFIDKNHPLAKGDGKVFYHRHMASLAAGRWITNHDTVEHLDGNTLNHEPSNLKVTSPEERKAARRAEVEANRQARLIAGRVKTTCETCGKEVLYAPSDPRRFCSDPCFRKSLRRFEVSAEELKALVWSHPTVQVAKMLGVSDVAVAKRCKALGVKKPPQGYWLARERR